jgi:hypothetical protein
VIAVVPLHRASTVAVVLADDVDGFGMQGRLGAIEMLDEGFDAAFVLKTISSRLGAAQSLSMMRTPELRNASSRRRCSSVA